MHKPEMFLENTNLFQEIWESDGIWSQSSTNNSEETEEKYLEEELSPCKL